MSTTGGALLKFLDSDTPIFPYNSGEQNRWGYVDAIGNVLISPEDSHIVDRWADFYGGLGAVRYDDGSAWVIDTKGSKQFAIYPNYADWNYVLRDGLMPNRARDSGQWGYVDGEGRWVIGPRFDFAFPFAAQRAVVTVGKLRGIIDAKGKWIVPPFLSFAIGYADGLICVEKAKRFSYLDINGRPVFDRDFEHATLFRHGLAVVREGNLDFLIDLTGKVVSARFERLMLGNDARSPAIVNENGRSGILLDGKAVFLEGEIFEPFSCGRAILHDDKGGYAHFIGPDGSRLFGTAFWRPEPFVLNRAAVQRSEGGDGAWIDQDGKTVFRWSAAGRSRWLEEKMGPQ